MRRRPRKLNFVHFKTPQEIWLVCDAFERGGFFDDPPEYCVMRNGVFLLEDPVWESYVIVVCRNNNGRTIWQ